MGATGIERVENRDAAKSPTLHKPGPTTNSYLAQNVNSAKVQKPWVRLIMMHCLEMSMLLPE